MSATVWRIAGEGGSRVPSAAKYEWGLVGTQHAEVAALERPAWDRREADQKKRRVGDCAIRMATRRRSRSS